MKKVVVAAVACYLVVAAVLLWNDEPSSGSVRILTVERPSAFLLTEAAERFSFFLYLDDPEAFPADRNNILSAAIGDADETLALTLVEVARTGMSIRDGDVDYDEFRYAFTTAGIAIDAGTIELTDALLSLEYAGGLSGSYAVGDVSFVFGDPGEPRHLDFTRLFAIYNDVDGRDGLAGLVIGLESKTGSPIRLLSVDLHLADLAVSLGEAVALDAVPAADLAVGDLLADPARTLLSPPVAGSLSFEDGLYFLPIVHAGRIHPAARFPIELSYEYDGRAYRFLIDDFAFRSAYADPSAYGEAVHRYEHLR